MATNETIADNAADAANERLQTPVIEYQIRGRRVVRESALAQLKAAAFARGLASSKRGLSVAKIEDAQS